MTLIAPILLVEDSDLDAELTGAALAELRLANPIVRLRDGVEALDYLASRGAYAERAPGHPVVVLLDLKMPRVDGLEVLSWIRADPTWRQLPVVMLTSSREERDLVRSYELGANAFVVKPVDGEQFTEAVRAIGAFWALINEPATGRGPG